MEMMRVRILISVCALMSCEVQTQPANVKDSSEQSALQEALLLVELLKSEYSRVLREKNSIKENEIDEKDLQTCAPTTASIDITHTPTDIPIRHIEQSSTSETLKPFTAQGSQRNYHNGYRADSQRRARRPPQAYNANYYDFPRRRFINYPDYYGNYGRAQMWRRRDYDNIFGPGQTIPPSTISQSTTVSVTNSPTDTTLSSFSTTASTTRSEMSISSFLSHTSSSSIIHSSTTVSSTTPKYVTFSVKTLKPPKYRVSIPTILSSLTLPTLISVLNTKQPSLILKRAFSIPNAVNKKTQTKKRTVSKTKQKKPPLPLKKTTIKSTYEPEQAQVAAELENELEGAPSLPSSHRQPVTWRPTTRVHMAKSTPFHIPLPENHAFCFTNPKNSLCRTFIK